MPLTGIAFVLFQMEIGRLIMSRMLITATIYNRHEFSDIIYFYGFFSLPNL
jgi:hypothetical protein